MSHIQSLSCIALLSGVALLAAGARAPLAAQPWSVQQQMLLRQQMLREQMLREQMLRQQMLRQQLTQRQAAQRLLYMRALQQARQQALAPSAPPVVAPVLIPVPVETPVPVEAAAPQQNLAGVTMTGSEDLASYGALEFRFTANGKVTMVDADGTHTGRYTRTGNRFTLRFYGDTVVYAGTLDGDTLAGAARNGKNNWNFSVSR